MTAPIDPREAPLAPAATAQLIRALFGSQLACARQLGFSDRQVRYWCQSGAPPHVRAVLRDMRDNGLSFQTARKRLRKNRGRRKIVTASDGSRFEEART